MRFTLNGQALDAVAIITFVCNVAQDTKDTMAFLWRIICHNAHGDVDQVCQLRRLFQGCVILMDYLCCSSNFM